MSHGKWATVAREVTRATKKEGLDFTPEPTVLKGIEKALSFFYTITLSKPLINTLSKPLIN